MAKSSVPFPSPSESPLRALSAGLLFWLVVVAAAMLLGPHVEPGGPERMGALGKLITVGLGSACFLGFHCAVRGCDSGGQYRFGTYGHLLKLFAIVFSSFIVVPHLLWTGRGLLRMVRGEVRLEG